MGKSTILMAIFNSYVKLSEGMKKGTGIWDLLRFDPSKPFLLADSGRFRRATGRVHSDNMFLTKSERIHTVDCRWNRNDFEWFYRSIRSSLDVVETEKCSFWRALTWVSMPEHNDSQAEQAGRLRPVHRCLVDWQGRWSNSSNLCL